MQGEAKLKRRGPKADAIFALVVAAEKVWSCEKVLHRRKPGCRGPYCEALVGPGITASPVLNPDKVRRVRSTAEEKLRRQQLLESSVNQVGSKEDGMTSRPNQATRRRAKNDELREDIAAFAAKLDK